MFWSVGEVNIFNTLQIYRDEAPGERLAVSPMLPPAGKGIIPEAEKVRVFGSSRYKFTRSVVRL